MTTLKITKNPLTAAWAFSSNMHLRNFCMEGKKEILDVTGVFPELFHNVLREKFKF